LVLLLLLASSSNLGDDRRCVAFAAEGLDLMEDIVPTTDKDDIDVEADEKTLISARLKRTPRGVDTSPHAA
tara:strand:+ start:143 stop:355 length:213 start_codon:yes stop_codon:yes gene_type:complete